MTTRTTATIDSNKMRTNEKVQLRRKRMTNFCVSQFRDWVVVVVIRFGIFRLFDCDLFDCSFEVRFAQKFN